MLQKVFENQQQLKGHPPRKFEMKWNIPIIFTFYWRSEFEWIMFEKLQVESSTVLTRETNFLEAP